MTRHKQSGFIKIRFEENKRMAYPSAQVVAESDMVRYHRAEQDFNKSQE